MRLSVFIFHLGQREENVELNLERRSGDKSTLSSVISTLS